jgi:hypothetical protein
MGNPYRQKLGYLFFDFGCHIMLARAQSWIVTIVAAINVCDSHPGHGKSLSLGRERMAMPA